MDAGTKKFQRLIDDYLDACQSFVEADMYVKVADEMIWLVLAEARRYSQTRAVSHKQFRSQANIY